MSFSSTVLFSILLRVPMSPAVRASIALGLMAGFYLLAIATGVGLFGFAWIAIKAKSAATAKVAFFSAVAGGSVLLSLRPRRDKFVPPGPRLTKEAQPELFKVVEDVAHATNQAMPVEVYAIPDVNAWVTTRGGLLGVGGRRVMGLGIPLLHLLTVDQLKAVLAHEFGHYGGGDTKIGRLVYHTRLGLGRTLEAVEGKSIEVLFNAYGKLVMRVSTKVARHQEFAADAFAARATSGKDLADSLQKLDLHGGLFPLFLASNMHAVVEEGYWAPIGEGFSAFCASPFFNGTTTRPVADQNAAETHADSQHAPDETYDSHPSTEARVAALAGLQVSDPEVPSASPRVADRRVAGSLLREPDEIEFELFRPQDPQFARLKPVTWPDVTPKVLVPRWQRIARERADILKRVRIESPPAVGRDIVQLGRAAGGQKVRMMDQSDVMQHVLFAIACGVGTRLLEKGWTPMPSPNLFCEFERGEERVDPMRRIFEIGHGTAPAEDWAAFCAREDLSGPLG
jgi:heat shock protein HtpX